MAETQELETKTPPKVDILQKEKMRKEAIAQAKYQTQFTIEQNKLMRAQNEKMRLDIENQELSARSWKAWYDKMYYSIECETLEPLYKEYQERAKARIEEERKKYDEEQKKLEQNMDELAEEIKSDSIPQEEELNINSLQETSDLD